MTLAEPPGEWVDRAACAQQWGDLFYPDKGSPTLEQRAAVAVCRGCDVRAECLDYALAHNEKFGIWGGLTVTQRENLLRERRRRAVS